MLNFEDKVTDCQSPGFSCPHDQVMCPRYVFLPKGHTQYKKEDLVIEPPGVEEFQTLLVNGEIYLIGEKPTYDHDVDVYKHGFFHHAFRRLSLSFYNGKFEKDGHFWQWERNYNMGGTIKACSVAQYGKTKKKRAKTQKKISWVFQVKNTKKRHFTF